MSKEMEFFIYLLESYAAEKKISAAQVLERLDRLELTDFIFGMYEQYHQERLQNAFDDIDKLVEERERNAAKAR